jgi:hypothetical protein
MEERGQPIIGQLKKLSAREAFSHEAHVFTPWLAENLHLLGNEIGVPLTLLGTEVAVGAFSLDIHAQDPDGRSVAIENQFGKTDHDHLGKSLVYAAGLNASVIVWLAEKFRDEHRQVLDWLNENMGEDVAFFAIELSTIKIDESAPALLFDVVCRPNNFQKQVRLETREKRKWTRDTFMVAINGNNPKWGKVADEIFTYADEQGWSSWYGSGRKHGSTFFYCRNGEKPMLFGIWTDGSFHGGWDNHQSHRGDQRWRSLIDFFIGLDPSLEQTDLTHQKLPFDALLGEESLSNFLAVVTDVENSFSVS